MTSSLRFTLCLLPLAMACGHRPDRRAFIPALSDAKEGQPAPEDKQLVDEAPAEDVEKATENPPQLHPVVETQPQGETQPQLDEMPAPPVAEVPEWGAGSAESAEILRICSERWERFRELRPLGRIFLRETIQRSYKELTPQTDNLILQSDIIPIMPRTVLTRETHEIVRNDPQQVQIRIDSVNLKIAVDVWTPERFIGQCLSNFLPEVDFFDPAYKPYFYDLSPDERLGYQRYAYPNTLNWDNISIFDYMTVFQSFVIVEMIYSGEKIVSEWGEVNPGDPYKLRVVNQLTILREPATY